MAVEIPLANGRGVALVDEMAIRYFGEFAVLNFPRSDAA